MKSFFLVLYVTLSFTLLAQSDITIAPSASVTIENPVTDPVEYILKNKTNVPLEVSILSDGEQTGGFGFGAHGKETIPLREEGSIVLTNNSDKAVSISYDYKIVKEKAVDIKNSYISLNFKNNSAKSIPLIIPTVMNPNLSPFSNSGVSLQIGQKIYFKYKGKRRVLLVISKDNYQDEIIDVAQVLKERKKQIDSK